MDDIVVAIVIKKMLEAGISRDELKEYLLKNEKIDEKINNNICYYLIIEPRKPWDWFGRESEVTKECNYHEVKTNAWNYYYHIQFGVAL